MADWGETGRQDEFWFELVDPFTLAVVDSVQCIPENSSVTYGYYTDNLSEAQLDIGSDTYIRDGRCCLIRVNHRVTLPASGVTETECLGTFFAQTSSKEALYMLEKHNIQCYGPMYRLTQDAFADDFFRPMGSKVEEGIRGSMEYSGGTVITKFGVDTERTHTIDVWYQMGENRAESLRTLAGYAGWRLGDSDYGELTIEKYVEPKDREIFYTFEAGANCVYLSGFTEEDSEDEVYNRVVGWWSRDKEPSEPDGFGLSDRYVADLPDGHDMSYRKVGRRMTATLEISEPCSHEDLVNKVVSYLNEHSTNSKYIEIEHVQIPHLRAGMVVNYQNDRDVSGGVNYKCEVTQIDMSALTPGCKCKTKMKILGETPLVYTES